MLTLQNELSLDPALERIVNLAPILTELVSDEDIMVAITDTKQYVYFSPSATLNAGIKVGDPYLEHDIFGNIFRTKERHVQVAPPEYGTPFKAFGIPIFNSNREIVGAIGFGISLKKEFELFDMFKTLETIGVNIQDKAHNLLSQTEQLASTLDEIYNNSKVVYSNSEKINDVSTFIEQIARQSNLLGLNASIEASRAGQYGKTFAVVANEIRKLSAESSKATGQIESSLGGIRGSIEEISVRLEEIAEAVQSQAKDAEYFAETVQELGNLSNKINEFINILVN